MEDGNRRLLDTLCAWAFSPRVGCLISLCDVDYSESCGSKDASTRCDKMVAFCLRQAFGSFPGVKVTATFSVPVAPFLCPTLKFPAPVAVNR